MDGGILCDHQNPSAGKCVYIYMHIYKYIHTYIYIFPLCLAQEQTGAFYIIFVLF